MKYLYKSFSVNPGSSSKYRDNYDRIFGKKRVSKEESLSEDEDEERDEVVDTEE